MKEFKEYKAEKKTVKTVSTDETVKPDEIEVDIKSDKDDDRLDQFAIVVTQALDKLYAVNGMNNKREELKENIRKIMRRS